MRRVLVWCLCLVLAGVGALRVAFRPCGLSGGP
jgi:hypothetical protein